MTARTHTPRRLIVQNLGDSGERFDLEAEGLGILFRVSSLSDDTAADAYRLAACWNALEHLDDDVAARLVAWLERYNNDELRQMLDEEGV